tara:strand:- start:586 stop:1212 length:627 start_codon:yes stop_codon:yes gene_type:complete
LKYKKYFRKTSLKQKGVGDFFLNEVLKVKPKTFLEIGVFQGVTAKNVCKLLYEIHGNNFTYIGLDLFEETNIGVDEIVPEQKISNPFKKFYFKYIIKQNPYSEDAVKDFLKEFKNNIHLIKGNSNKILKEIETSKIDFVFLDGGHDFNTVKNDLNYCRNIILNGGIIFCDDYDLSFAPGVKKAIDEFVEENKFSCEILWNYRFAKIKK